MKTVRSLLCLILCAALLLPLLQVRANAGTITILLGDVDMNGKVTASDARQILRFAAGLDEINDDLLNFACDFNNNGKPDPADARAALRTAADITKPRYVRINNDAPEATSGDFVFTTYGWGHGVGMSQYGAQYFAKEMGWGYRKILSHYYTDISFAVDSTASLQKLRIDGVDYPMVQGIARVLDRELDKSYNTEARKAQAVSIYCYLKYHNKSKAVGEAWSSSGVAHIGNSESPQSVTVTQVSMVLGEYMTYNGTVINAVFSAASAGTSAAAKTIWGGDLPYLQPVDSFGDILTKYFGMEKTMTSAQVKTALINAYGNNIRLSDYPDEWFTILSHDGAVDADFIGYIIKAKVGGYTVKGENLKSALGLRSSCFTVKFIPYT